MRSLTICTHPAFSGDKIEKNVMVRACSAHGGTGEAHIELWWGNLRDRNHLGGPGIDGSIILRWNFRKLDVAVWTGSSWLRIGTGDGHL
jgi:hypothetical protein